MKTITPLLLLAASLTAACTGQVIEAPGNTTSTGDAPQGGAGGAPSTTCTELITDLTAKIALARACTSVGTWDDCDQSVWVKDECDCGAPLNHVSTAEVTAALAAADAVAAAGCKITCTPDTCYDRYKDPAYQGGCMATAPGVGLCTFPGGV